MLDKLQAICNKYEELSAKSEQPDFYADPQKAAKLLREKNDLEPIVEAFHAYNQAAASAARKAPCLPTVCSGCTPCTPRKWAGALS